MYLLKSNNHFNDDFCTFSEEKILEIIVWSLKDINLNENNIKKVRIVIKADLQFYDQRRLI